MADLPNCGTPSPGTEGRDSGPVDAHVVQWRTTPADLKLLLGVYNPIGAPDMNRSVWTGEATVRHNNL